jgi:Tfp pilus assembly protein PilF
MRFSFVRIPKVIRFLSIVAVMPAALGCAHSAKAQKNLTADDRARLWVNVAVSSLTEGDPIGALQNLSMAEKEADLPEIHHVRALAYHMQRDDEKALVEARQAVAMNPHFSEANNTLGKLLMDRGRYREAVPPLTRAAEDTLSRNAYRAYTNLGILYYRQGQYPQSRKEFARAIDLESNQTCVAHYYLGHIDLRESKLKDAIIEYERATKHLCADFADAHYALGVALERDQQFDSARKKFLEVTSRYPTSPLADQAFDQLRKIP